MNAITAVDIKLTLRELREGAHTGVERTLLALHKQRDEPYGHPVERGRWEADIHSAIAEKAFAKYRNVYWCDVGRLDYEGDVGPYQVRSTDHDHGHLLLYPRDHDEAYFVLAVTAALPIVSIRGFILALAGKRDEWRTNGRLPRENGGWMVPQDGLQSIERLPEVE